MELLAAASKIEHDFESIASTRAHFERILDVLLGEFVAVGDERFHVHSSTAEQAQAHGIRVAVAEHSHDVDFPANQHHQVSCHDSGCQNRQIAW